MKDSEKIAVEVLKFALSVQPEACLIGNVTSQELAALAARHILTCPKCGATAWCDIDCDLCCLCSWLVRGGEEE